MAAFDRMPPEMRQALANAPYAFPSAAVHSLRHLDGLVKERLIQRDLAKVGPVPLVYKRKRRRR